MKSRALAGIGEDTLIKAMDVEHGGCKAKQQAKTELDPIKQLEDA